MKPTFEIPEQQLALIRDVLAAGRPFTLKARGWSMAPLVFSGDLLTLAPASPESLRIGDIVAFVKERRLFIHRIVRSAPEARILVTKGDAHRTLDPAASYDDILGKVTAFSRGPFRLDLGREPWKTLNRMAGRFSRPAGPDPLAILLFFSRESLKEDVAGHPPPAPPIKEGEEGSAPAVKRGKEDVRAASRIWAWSEEGGAAVWGKEKKSDYFALEGKELLETFSRWDDLFEAACSEGLVPLLHHNLKTLGILSQVPFAFQRRLKQEARNLLARHILLCREFSKVLSLFADKGIPLVALKGPALSHLYPQGAPRPSEDLDFLIKAGDLPEAGKVLIQSGYKPPASPAWRNSTVFSKDIPPGFRVMVDLHTHFIGSPELAAGFGLDMAEIWERSEPCILEAGACRRLSREDNVFYLCVHLAVEHSLRGLLWFCDLDRLIRDSPPDWDLLRISAGNAGFLRALRCCLTELNRLYETPVPGALMEPRFRSIQGKKFRWNEYLLPFFLLEKSKRWTPLWEFLRLSPGTSLFGKIKRGARILTRILQG